MLNKETNFNEKVLYNVTKTSENERSKHADYECLPNSKNSWYRRKIHQNVFKLNLTFKANKSSDSHPAKANHLQGWASQH